MSCLALEQNHLCFLERLLLMRAVQLDINLCLLAGLRTLTQIMADLNHNWIDVLKVDIEVCRPPQDRCLHR